MTKRDINAIVCTTHNQLIPCKNDETCEWSAKHEDFDKAIENMMKGEGE